MFTIFSFGTGWIFRTPFSEYKDWIKESDQCWTSHCEQECSKRQRGEDADTERRVQSSLWTTTQAYISRLVAQTALTVDKAAISLPMRDTVSNCHPLTEGTLPLCSAGVKSYRAWKRRRRCDGCSRGEEKGPLIEQTLAIFCCPETAVLLLWDTEWDEDIRGERGQAEVLKCQ